MNKIIPIANIVASVIALVISISGLSLAALTKLSMLFAPLSIVVVIVGFIASVINCAVGFAFVKSKLCLASGIIASISMFMSIAAFIIML